MKFGNLIVMKFKCTCGLGVVLVVFATAQRCVGLHQDLVSITEIKDVLIHTQRVELNLIYYGNFLAPS
jgi:uncharacterized membrane protein